jgi:shikimate kinase
MDPIVIAGFMGSGKTTVARALARLLQCELIDLDRHITEKTGRSPKEIIEQDGEPVFRELETRFLSEVLTASSARVIALGGGAWTVPANRALIEQHLGHAVWLDTPFETCWQRISASGSERPLARDKQQTRRLYENRREVYQLASLHVRTDERLSDDEIAARILAAVTGNSSAT